MNLEIYNVFKSPDIVTLIKEKLRRLERLNVARMDGERTVKKLLEENRGGGGVIDKVDG
jgi:hypothetical protein